MSPELPAATVDGLFETEVPVQGPDTAQRNQAIRQALGQVLVKVSGSRDIADRPALAEELGQAPRYVQQFRYLEPGHNGDQPVGRLLVQFDGAAVTRMLRERGLPVWGEARPTVLVWLGIEDQGERRWYVPDTDPTGWDALQRAANERGLPLLLPLMDLDDQRVLRPDDLWGGGESAVRAASERYAPDAILVGRLADLGGAWRGSWTLLQDAAESWEGRPGERDRSLAAGVSWAADALAARNAPMGTGSATSLVELRVAGILGLAEYGRVKAHLGSLSMVERSRLLALEPGVARFQLKVRGGAAALATGIALGGLLEQAPQAGTERPATDTRRQGGRAVGEGPETAGEGPSGGVRPAVLSYRVRP